MDIVEIKRLLLGRVQAVAEMLLPNGRKEGNEWRAGSLGGEKGKSLGVHLSGDKIGLWSDFNGGEHKGDLIGLWMAVRQQEIGPAIKDIKKYLGVEEPKAHNEPKKTYTRPAKPRCCAPKARVMDYLTQDRNLPYAVLEAYHVGEDGSRIIFPFLDPKGDLILAKAREAVAGADTIPTAANCEPILFGWQAIPANEREIVITEGEIDALSMAAYGFSALSVPFGGGKKGKHKWIENEFERLERFEKIYLATDMDKTGDEAAEEITARLGRHRCYRVKLPKKDANDCLVAGISREIIAACVEAAESMDPEGLRSAAVYEDKVAQLFWPTHEAQIGYSMPYAGLNGEILFRPGELTLWSGASGDGKSQIITDCVPKWVSEGSRICIASFEMKPEQTLKRMVKQAGGTDRPTLRFIHDTLAYLGESVLLYEKIGKSGVDPLLEIFDYAHAKYGCDQFVIDSLMRLGIASDDYTGQEQAVFRLVDWTISKNIHLHLVAHTRKSERDRGVPGIEDVKGASEIGANAFNILTIWRNRKIEDEGDPETKPDMTEEPGVTVNVAKQRNGDFEGKVKLYFNRRTYQYFSARDNRRIPRCYVSEVGLIQAAE